MKKRKLRRRNPVARAVRRLRPQVVPSAKAYKRRPKHKRSFRNQPEWPFSFLRFGIGYPDSFKFLSRLMPLLLFSGDTPGLAASPGAS